MPMDYLSRLAVVLRGINRNVWYIPNRFIVFTPFVEFLSIFNIQGNEKLAKVKER